MLDRSSNLFEAPPAAGEPSPTTPSSLFPPSDPQRPGVEQDRDASAADHAVDLNETAEAPRRSRTRRLRRGPRSARLRGWPGRSLLDALGGLRPGRRWLAVAALGLSVFLIAAVGAYTMSDPGPGHERSTASMPASAVGTLDSGTRSPDTADAAGPADRQPPVAPARDARADARRSQSRPQGARGKAARAARQRARTKGSAPARAHKRTARTAQPRPRSRPTASPATPARSVPAAAPPAPAPAPTSSAAAPAPPPAASASRSTSSSPQPAPSGPAAEFGFTK